MTSSPILDVLTREGVLIDVSVRYWRAAKKLRPEDLGLDPDRVTDRRTLRNRPFRGIIK